MFFSYLPDKKAFRLHLRRFTKIRHLNNITKISHINEDKGRDPSYDIKVYFGGIIYRLIVILLEISRKIS